MFLEHLKSLGLNPVVFYVGDSRSILVDICRIDLVRCRTDYSCSGYTI